MIIAKIFVYRDAEGLSLKNKLKPYGLLVLVAGVIIALDQITKAIVINNIQMGGTWMPLEWLAPYARIVHWYNTGVAFGMFQNGNTIFLHSGHHRFDRHNLVFPAGAQSGLAAASGDVPAAGRRDGEFN
jgi:hypothetical protein